MCDSVAGKDVGPQRRIVVMEGISTVDNILILVPCCSCTVSGGGHTAVLASTKVVVDRDAADEQKGRDDSR